MHDTKPPYMAIQSDFTVQGGAHCTYVSKKIKLQIMIRGYSRVTSFFITWKGMLPNLPQMNGRDCADKFFPIMKPLSSPMKIIETLMMFRQ